MMIQAYVWFSQNRFGEAKSKLLRIIGLYDGAGVAPRNLETIEKLLQIIEVGTKGLITSN